MTLEKGPFDGVTSHTRLVTENISAKALTTAPTTPTCL